MSTSVSADIAKEKMHALIKPKLPDQQEQQQKEVLVKQDPSTSGIQWAYQTQAPPAAQESAQANMNVKSEGQAAQTKGQPEIVTPGEADLAVLSSTVSVNDKSVAMARGKGLRLAGRLGLNAAAIEQSFREIYKQSKSHNLLLERFMSMVKFSSVKMLCTMLGMSAEEQDRIQSEVREEALAEIDIKLKNDWAHAVALTEII